MNTLPMLRRTFVCVLSALFAGIDDHANGHGALAALSDDDCQVEWVRTFGTVEPMNVSINNDVRFQVVFDDGSGPALYIGGRFSMAGGLPRTRIAKWHGQEWAELSDTLGFNTGTVLCGTVFDDGTGSALYVGGSRFEINGEVTHGIAKWDGEHWSPVGGGLQRESSIPVVHAMAVFEGSLYVGGRFDTAGAAPASNIARWDGEQWSDVAGGVAGGPEPIRTLQVINEGLGAGPWLIAGGTLTSAGGGASPAQGLARWNGSVWTTVGSNNGPPSVNTMFAHHDENGPILIAVGGTAVPEIWNGSTWSTLPALPGEAFSFGLFDDGSGVEVYAGGRVLPDGGYLARLDEGNWTLIEAALDGPVTSMAAFDDGVGERPSLYLGGLFSSAGGLDVSRLVSWDGTQWFSPPISNLDHAVNGWVWVTAVHDDGTGPALYAGGSFNQVGALDVGSIAKWTGSSWEPLLDGVVGDVFAMASFDDGSGPALIVGGQFTSASGVEGTANVARWKDGEWTVLDRGFNGVVTALSVIDTGTGPTLYAGGGFTMSGGTSVNRIAKWDGATWQPMAGGFVDSPFLGFKPVVNAIAGFDDGGGHEIYAGGLFVSADTLPVNSIAKWNGQSWEALDGGVSSAVDALQVFDDGSGPALFAGGRFLSAGGQEVHQIAKWDGEQWHSLNGGLNPGSDFTRVYALTVFDDGMGGGAELVAGGFFSVPTELGNLAHLAKWNGTRWARLGETFNGIFSIRAMCPVPSFVDNRLDLFIGLDTANSPMGDSYIARLSGCAPASPSLAGDGNGDGVVDLGDLLLVIINWGCTGPECPGDVSCDGTVNLADLLLVIINWGQVA